MENTLQASLSAPEGLKTIEPDIDLQISSLQRNIDLEKDSNDHLKEQIAESKKEN